MERTINASCIDENKISLNEVDGGVVELKMEWLIASSVEALKSAG